MSLWLVAIIAVVWAGIGVFGLALCRAVARKPPVPPARPRLRVVQSRERAGCVEFLPARGDEH